MKCNQRVLHIRYLRSSLFQLKTTFSLENELNENLHFAPLSYFEASSRHKSTLAKFPSKNFQIGILKASQAIHLANE